MNLRDLWDVDWLIEPLYDVIDHQLAAIIEQVDDGDEEWFDVDDARQHAETLFGIAFVAAQTYAARTVEDLNNLRMRRHKPEKKKEKPECYACDNRLLKEGMTRIQLINAAANRRADVVHDGLVGGKGPGVAPLRAVAVHAAEQD